MAAEADSAAEFVPASRSLTKLPGRRLSRLSVVEGRDADGLRHRPKKAELMLVGEQPGDQEAAVFSYRRSGVPGAP